MDKGSRFGSREVPDEAASLGRTEEPGMEEALSELRGEKERHVRLKADFENYKRRTERDREAASNRAERRLLLALVDLADGFDRALAHVDDSPLSVAAGVRGMQRQLRRLLESEGVVPFQSVGLTFDTARHEAIASVHDPAAEPGTVLDELGRGYLWKGALLRPARVRVAG